MTEADWDHLTGIVGWFGDKATAKYVAGKREHGGYLPGKGGLLQEAEAEALDQPIYLRTVRKQLEGVLTALDSGDIGTARLALRLILHGSPKDTLPV